MDELLMCGDPHDEEYSAIKSFVLLTHATTWRNLKGSRLVKEASLKMLHTLWFHFYDVLKKGKTINKIPEVMESSSCQRLGLVGGHNIKGIPWEFFGMTDFLYPGCGGGYMNLFMY